MHHLVAAHASSPMPMAMGSVMHAGASDSDPVAANPVEALSTAVASPVGCCDPMDMVGHPCLAVLTALIALVAALILVAVRCRSIESGRLVAAVSAVAARAPPAGGARVTQLCVLRC